MTMSIGIGMLLILIALAIGVVCCSTFEFKSPLFTTNIKIDPKKNLIAIFCLLIVFGVLLFYLLCKVNSPLEKVARASFEYYSCLGAKAKPGHCERKNYKLFATIADAEMNGIEGGVIEKAIERGKYEAKSGEI